MGVDKKRIVVALGGNALGENLDEQMRSARVAADAIAELLESGHQIVLVHGNGPQVGMIETAFETAAKVDSNFPILPMSVCVALSQGYIGYDLQNAIRMELDARGNNTPVVTLVTQVIVDPDDPAFLSPTKPIGGFITQTEASKLESQGIATMEDSGRGYRRVVASPKPHSILELETVNVLLKAGQIPIVAGGGGIPVSLVDGQYHGMSAIIDKDAAAAKLAELVNADLLIILTAVENVSIDFGKPTERKLEKLSADDAETYLAQGQFGKGSMEPKIQASLDFVRSGSGRKALITLLEKAMDGIAGKCGTLIE
jgi:carbamate kinase